MATIVRYQEGNQLRLPVASGVESNDLVVFGNQPAVALTDRDADGYATLKFDGVVNVELASASAEDAVYITPSTGALSLTDDADKVFFGVCITDSDADDMVDVRIGGIEPGSGS
jgi:predicted RecA/RadA family phage recombinase